MDSLSSPLHGFPPPEGGGLVHVRVLILMYVSQSQSPQLLHFVQPPSTPEEGRARVTLDAPTASVSLNSVTLDAPTLSQLCLDSYRDLGTSSDGSISGNFTRLALSLPQCFPSHSLDLLSSPSHGFPPPEGGGLVHVRVFDLMCVSQSQSPQLVHSVQPPSTAEEERARVTLDAPTASVSLNASEVGRANDFRFCWRRSNWRGRKQKWQRGKGASSFKNWTSLRAKMLAGPEGAATMCICAVRSPWFGVGGYEMANSPRAFHDSSSCSLNVKTRKRNTRNTLASILTD